MASVHVSAVSLCSALIRYRRDLRADEKIDNFDRDKFISIQFKTQKMAAPSNPSLYESPPFNQHCSVRIWVVDMRFFSLN